MLASDAFDDRGNLPAGVWVLTLNDVETRFSWTSRRRKLLGGLRRALEHLRSAGVPRVWIDGSFTTRKDDPNDIDGCWEYDPESVDADRLDPVFLDVSPPRQAMKRKYGVDFLISGVTLADTGQRVEEFFQSDRDGNPKGIIVVDLSREKTLS